MQVTSAKVCAFFAAAVLIVASFGCAPKYEPGGSGQDPAESGSIPELSDEVIRDRINEARVHEVMPESGTGEPISWSFDEDEPKEIAVMDKQINGTKATVVLDMKTRSSMRANILRFLSGQIRTQWELQSHVVIRRWEIVRVENISMKYKDVPKPSPSTTPAPQNSDR